MNRIYAVGFTTRSEYCGDRIPNFGGIFICKSKMSAIRKFCRGMGFKTLGDYVTSYPGKFTSGSKLRDIISPGVENTVTYYKNDISRLTNIAYSIYSSWQSQCDGVICDLRWPRYNNMFIAPKLDDLCVEVIGSLVNLTDIRFSILSCFCEDWNESLRK